MKSANPFRKLPRLVDCHIHTPLCGHASGTPEELVSSAAAANLRLITITCHIPMPQQGFAQNGIRMRHEQLPEYRAFVQQARELAAPLNIDVLYGIEAEIFPDPQELTAMRELLQSEPFDFVLGSLHHQLQIFRDWLATRSYFSDLEIVTAYFSTLAEAAESGIYDSLSHPDVIRLYSTLRSAFHPAAYEPIIKRALDRIAASGTCMEINTSGLIKGDYTVHPDPLIMDWALERNIPFTLGSDSHHPDMVGQFFHEIIPQFRAAGLPAIHYFRNRKRFTLEFR